MEAIHHYTLSGVYNDTYEMRFDGGPNCAAESSPNFKFGITAALVSVKTIANSSSLLLMPWF